MKKITTILLITLSLSYYSQDLVRVAYPNKTKDTLFVQPKFYDLFVSLWNIEQRKNKPVIHALNKEEFYKKYSQLIGRKDG